MGRVLAGILNRSIAEQTTDDRDRDAVLVEAATAAEVEREQIDRLLEESTRELPEEGVVRRLLEAAQVSDLDDAIRQVRDDGDLFEGEQVEGDASMQAASARILEAAGPGAQPGTRRYRVAVIRPGRAEGHGRRYYPRRMLEANAGNFGGQPIFFNHEDLGTILKRGHGSRDPRDLCGWLQEGATFDASYTEPDDAKTKRPAGAVVGEADFDDAAAELIDKFPKAVGLSINMDSTTVRVGRADDGSLAPLVEGVVKGSGSVDLITGKAGAGGKVLERLREAATLRYGSPHVDPAALDDDRLLEAVRQRPGLVERLREAPPAPPDPEDRVDTAKLIEALSSGEGSELLDRLVEAKVSEREEAIREDAQADSRRELDLRDMRDDAHRLIEARARDRGGILTNAFVDDLKGRYQLRDGRHPTPGLDVHDQVEDGEVKKAARERLIEAVEHDIQVEEAKLREAAPTMVRDLAPPAPETDPETGKPREPEPVKDQTAEELGLDSERVRRYQGVA